jgi:hypothetical protein
MICVGFFRIEDQAAPLRLQAGRIPPSLLHPAREDVAVRLLQEGGDDVAAIERPGQHVGCTIEPGRVVTMELNGVRIGAGHDQGCEGWQVLPSLESVSERRTQIRPGGCLEHVARRSGSDGVGDELIILMHRQKHNPGW